MIAGIVFDVVISMFLVRAVGYFARKVGIIDAAFSKKLSKLVLYIAQPVLIVASMIKMEATPENNKDIIVILIASLLAHVFCAVIGFFSMKVIKEENERKLSEIR
ncbi:MAG: AEC family transporter [Clostridia bacterium]|nr:AEC family transporter [Clostridia bacterium]